jgi:hypothetical protein
LSMTSTVCWVIVPCNSERSQHFQGIYWLHLEGQRVSQEREKQKEAVLLPFSCLAARWRYYVLPKCQTVSRLHGVTTQKNIYTQFLPAL